MPDPEPAFIERQLRIEAGSMPIRGTLCAAHGRPAPFHGWLGLWAAIEEIQSSAPVDDHGREETSPPEASGSSTALRSNPDQTLAAIREAPARIIATADAARRQLERDIYTGAQQDLVLIGPRLELAKRAIERDPAAATVLIADALEDLRRGLLALRDLAHRIYPAVLDRDGLLSALEQAVSRAPIPARLEADRAPRLSAEVEASVYFCCVQALENVAEHAGDGARATVRLHVRRGELGFEVADDGCGYDVAGAQPGRGLRNIEDRMDAIDGTLRVESAPGEGTRVSGRVALAGSTSAV